MASDPTKPSAQPTRRTHGKSDPADSPQLSASLPTTMDIAGLRKHSVIFEALSDEEAATLMQLARMVNHPARHTVFQEGEPGDHLLVVMHGRVKVSLVSPDGKEAILSILEAGDVFGEMALLDSGPRSATVTTMEKCSFLVIWRKDFLPFLERNPQVTFKLLAALSKRLRATNDMVGGLSFLNLPARLARILINLGQQYGKLSSDGIVIGIKLSQEELGNLVGVSRESVNRQIRVWVETGVLDYSHGTIILKNSDLLFRESLSLEH